MRRLLALAIASGCATPGPSPAPPPAAAVARDDDAAALKERVSRLERRVADVDAKLGLLLAQRAQPRPPASVTHGAPEPVGDARLGDAGRREEASLGAKAIDLGTKRSPYEEALAPALEPPDEPDDGPPVVIKLDGSSPRAGVTDAAPVADVRPTSDALEGASVEEQYRAAQARLKAGRDLEAIAAFEEILEREPRHRLADNAMYWIGWAHEQRGDHKLAVEVWQKLPVRYPRSAKVPDALFGMAQAKEALGEPAVAETLYTQLIVQYPKAEKVRDARRALQRLRPK